MGSPSQSKNAQPTTPMRLDPALKRLLQDCAAASGMTLSDLFKTSALRYSFANGYEVPDDFEFEYEGSGANAAAAAVIDEHRNKEGGRAAA